MEALRVVIQSALADFHVLSRGIYPPASPGGVRGWAFFGGSWCFLASWLSNKECEMKILALEKELPGATAESFRPLLQDEARRVWELQQSGLLREIHFDADRHTAVLLLECGGVEEARAVLSSLPLVAAGLIDFEIIPLAPYDGFARLFAERF
jgi:hypothetical protein